MRSGSPLTVSHRSGLTTQRLATSTRCVQEYQTRCALPVVCPACTVAIHPLAHSPTAISLPHRPQHTTTTAWAHQDHVRAGAGCCSAAAAAAAAAGDVCAACVSVTVQCGSTQDLPSANPPINSCAHLPACLILPKSPGCCCANLKPCLSHACDCCHCRRLSTTPACYCCAENARNLGTAPPDRPPFTCNATPLST